MSWCHFSKDLNRISSSKSITELCLQLQWCCIFDKINSYLSILYLHPYLNAFKSTSSFYIRNSNIATKCYFKSHCFTRILQTKRLVQQGFAHGRTENKISFHEERDIRIWLASCILTNLHEPRRMTTTSNSTTKREIKKANTLHQNNPLQPSKKALRTCKKHPVTAIFTKKEQKDSNPIC